LKKSYCIISSWGKSIYFFRDIQSPSSNYIKETASAVTKEYTFIGGNAYTAPVVAVT